MSYLDAYIEACPAYGWNGGPEFNTRIVQLMNGRERRNANWANAKHRYTLPFQNIRRDDYRNIRQMFEVCRAKLHCFRYRDPIENYADNAVFGIGNGSQLEFQLSTFSQIDGVTYQRGIYAIPTTPDDFVVTVDNAPATYTVDRDRGVVTFSVAPANTTVLRWSGTFDVWVRFDQDWLPFSLDNQGNQGYAHNGSVELIEMPPPEETDSNGP